jgi:hypothetical protein
METSAREKWKDRSSQQWMRLERLMVELFREQFFGILLQLRLEDQ